MGKKICRWVFYALVGTLLLGCSRDPNVRKQRFLQSGEQYLKDGKYREAALQFQNAIQLDPRFAEAHYQLAQCYLRESLWNSAYQELLRAVDLQPDNAAPQIELTKLLVAAREFQAAHDRATTVLALNPDSFEAQLLLANAD